MMWNRSSRKSSKEKFTSAQQAYDCALNLLSYRDFSNQKMRERLQQKGADEEQAEEACRAVLRYAREELELSEVIIKAEQAYSSCGCRKSMSRVANKVKLKYFGNQVFIKT